MTSINFEKKIMFIHIPKTAGTYIQNNLIKYYNFKNYLFRHTNHDKICRTKIPNQYLVKNHFLKNKIYCINEIFKNSPHNRDIGIFNYLMSMSNDEFNNIIGIEKQEINNFKKFCVVRNPYERFISGWAYCNKAFKRFTPFDIFILNPDNLTDFEYFHTFMPQYYHIIDSDNNIVVDNILKFENLENDFQNFLKLNDFENIIHDKNKSNTSIHENPLFYINDQTKLDLINKYIGDDFIIFNFTKFEKFDDFKNHYSKN
jgi:hypothetical protein